jgi:hypothetical protein
MSGTTRKNLLMLQKLCGKDAFKDVVLVTTKWGTIEEDVGEQREKRLKEVFWKTMVDHGSQIRGYKRSYDSAWEIVNLIREKEKKGLPIQIQKELVDLQKRIPQTEAGDALRNLLNTSLGDQKEVFRQLRLECEEGNQSPDLQKEYEEAERRLRSTLEQLQYLKIPLDQRILAAFMHPHKVELGEYRHNDSEWWSFISDTCTRWLLLLTPFIQRFHGKTPTAWAGMKNPILQKIAGRL